METRSKKREEEMDQEDEEFEQDTDVGSGEAATIKKSQTREPSRDDAMMEFLRDMKSEMKSEMKEMNQAQIGVNERMCQGFAELKEGMKEMKAEIMNVVNERLELTEAKVELRFQKAETNTTELNEKVNECGTQVAKVIHEVTRVKENVEIVEEKIKGNKEQFEVIIQAIQEDNKDLRTKMEERSGHDLGEALRMHLSRDFDSDKLPKFHGDNRNNPKIFIKNMGQNLGKIKDEQRMKNAIRSTMKGEAEVWFSMVEETITTFEEFKAAFLKKYWGETEQDRVRGNLNWGRYKGYERSRENYAIRLINLAQQVEPKYEERELIKAVARHFEREVKSRIGIERVMTLEEFLELLKRFDETVEFKYEALNGHQAPPQKRPEQQREHHSTQDNRNGNRFENTGNHRGNFESSFRGRTNGRGRYGGDNRDNTEQPITRTIATHQIVGTGTPQQATTIVQGPNQGVDFVQ